MAKRGQGEGTISQRPDGTWWARISLGKDENGKQKRKAFYGKTRKEVQQKLTAALNEVNQGAYIEPSKMTVGQWVDYWMKECKRHSLKPTTYEHHYHALKCYIKPKLGNIKLKDLRREMVQRFVNDLVDDGNKKPSYIERIFRVLSCALKEAVTNDFIIKNPADGVKLPKKNRAERRVLTPNEQTLFIETAKQYYQGDAFILMLGTGMRVGETLALTWDDISLEKAEVRINKTQAEFTDPHAETPKHQITHGTPKTLSSYRTIPLLPQLVEMLKAHQEKQEADAKEMGSAYADTNLVFCTRFGTSILICDMQKKIKLITMKAGLEGVHTHTLRHTFATRGLENGIPLKVMQELLGHSSLSMTADLYTHVLPDTKKSSIMKLEGTIRI